MTLGKKRMKFAWIVLFGIWAAISSHGAERWRFHFEAEKGEITAETPNEPASLDKFLIEAPRFSPDPLAAEAVISGASVRKLGSLAGREILEARVRVRGDYYTHIYILL